MSELKSENDINNKNTKAPSHTVSKSSSKNTSHLFSLSSKLRHKSKRVSIK